jgi:molybdopterin-binding protein
MFKINGRKSNLWIESLFPVNLVGHDVVEIVSGDESIIIQIGLGEDVLNFIISQVLSQFSSDLLQLQSGESTLK